MPIDLDYTTEGPPKQRKRGKTPKKGKKKDSEERAFRNVDIAIYSQLIERIHYKVERGLEGQIEEGLYDSKYLYLIIFVLKN
jgi:hypothetical protein